MPRRNPGPFEPIGYITRTPAFFRIVGLGGLVLFTIIFLDKAAAHSAGAFIVGLALLAALWIESTLTVCRRCRHFGTWHCAGQAIIAARLFTPLPPGIGQPRVMLHFGLAAIYLIYGLFWIWHGHGIAAGTLFTLWAALFVMSAIPPDGFSWKSAPRSSQAA
jgi:hypothetical protein